MNIMTRVFIATLVSFALAALAEAQVGHDWAQTFLLGYLAVILATHRKEI